MLHAQTFEKYRNVPTMSLATSSTSGAPNGWHIWDVLGLEKQGRLAHGPCPRSWPMAHGLLLMAMATWHGPWPWALSHFHGGHDPWSWSTGRVTGTKPGQKKTTARETWSCQTETHKHNKYKNEHEIVQLKVRRLVVPKSSNELFLEVAKSNMFRNAHGFLYLFIFCVVKQTN